MSLLPLLLSLLSCGDGDDPAGAACCTGSDDPALWADDPWSLVEVAPLTPRYEQINGARQVLRAAGNDAVYIVDGPGLTVRILTPTWAQPTGEWCVGGAGTVDNCAGGTVVTSGVVQVTESPASCLDDVADKLYLVKPLGARLDVVGTNRAGTSWETYNRAATFRTVVKEDTDQLDDACAARDGQVVLAGKGQLAILDESFTVQARIPMSGTIRQLQHVGDTGWLAAFVEDGSAWLVSTAELRAVQIVPADGASAMTVDPDRGAVWIARTGEGALLRLQVGAAGIEGTHTVDTCGRIEQLAVDRRTGAVHALSRCGQAASGYEALVLDTQGIRASVALEEDPLALVPPGALGQLGVLVQTDPAKDTAGADIPAAVAARAWHVVDPTDPRPPLSMWVVTTLEEPFTNADMACTPAENAASNFQALVQQLQENIPVLQATGLPVAVGVTWEFGSKARACGLDGVLDELQAAGFVLGTMIHDKPCYSCTDEEVPGQSPEVCAANDADWAAADDAAACWPSDENYCSRGDQDCWFSWVGAKVLDVDQWIPGGSQFIFGADRHRLWGWEYIQHGYRSFPRADGGVGYRISMFQGNWIYPDIQDQDDPRAKDAAPWTPELLGTTWFPADGESWEQDSAFSDLLYMPGSSTALSRLYDAELSDLSLVHLFDEVTPMVTTQEDLDTVFAAIAQPVAHRTDRPGTYYFHLADLTGYPLLPGEGDDRVDQQALLLDLKARVEAYYGDEGLGVVRWQGPLEARAAVDAWLAGESPAE
ncbi:hypothetical protein L6R53_20265 [Myxococcota bacterium]|nr:hypothetical protein [Myxococcota bacterium]